MAQKPETRFRAGKVNPFLKRLKNTKDFSVQQQAIRGTPDKLLCVSGLFVGLELKAKGGVVTLLQAKTLEDIEKAGGIALVADPDNWDEVSNFILKLDEGESNERKRTSHINVPSTDLWRRVLAKARPLPVPE